jgi:hypothetical protein
LADCAPQSFSRAYSPTFISWIYESLQNHQTAQTSRALPSLRHPLQPLRGTSLYNKNLASSTIETYYRAVDSRTIFSYLHTASSWLSLPGPYNETLLACAILTGFLRFPRNQHDSGASGHACYFTLFERAAFPTPFCICA